jgi:hypothetical protein
MPLVELRHRSNVGFIRFFRWRWPAARWASASTEAME